MVSPKAEVQDVAMATADPEFAINGDTFHRSYKRKKKWHFLLKSVPLSEML